MSVHRMPHTSTWRNRRVIVKLLDGTVFRDRFIERADRWVRFAVRGKVRRSDIKAFGDEASFDRARRAA